MCGIVGKYYFSGSSVDNKDIEKMMEAISHRGPDSSGKYEDERIALGFQRLSIIDTVFGNQPLYNESKSVILIVNGEIYNYKELQYLLKVKGHIFATNSDCEVIIHLYEEYGIDFIEKLNGMFAFCLYDYGKQLLYIARDRVGIKPLYYHINSTGIYFSSEIKGILASDDVKAVENDDVLGEYICFRYLANFRTFFSGIDALEPGTYIEASKDGCKFIKYWDTSTYFLNTTTDTNIIDTIDSALFNSVQRQMMTDVPLGTQLSGGVDSSVVSKLAAGFSSGLKTFTVSFFESEYDESSYAKQLADYAGLNYHQIRVDNQTFAANLPQVIWYHDEPLCHANSVHMYLLCKYAKEHVKVLLTGEGADELFAGYPRYLICRLGEIYNSLNTNLAYGIKFILSGIPVRKLQKLLNNLGLSPRDLVLWNSCFASKKKVSWLMDNDVMPLPARLALQNSVWNDDLSLFDNLLKYEQQSYLQPILMRQDKMSMAASIESRVPILDNEMLALANSIPYSYKIRHFNTKQVFKSVAARHIPNGLVYKKKAGFGVPIDEWLRDSKGLGRYLDMLLDLSREINSLNRIKLEKIACEHRNNKANHGDVLWPLINYVIWKDKFFC